MDWKQLSMIKRFFTVRIFPLLSLSLKPILLGAVLLFLFSLIGAYFGLFRSPFISMNAFEALPNSSAIILEIKSLEDHSTYLKKYNYTKDIIQIAPIKTWSEEMNIIDSLLTKSSSLNKIKSKSKIVSALTINGKEDNSWVHIFESNSTINIQKVVKQLSLKIINQSELLGSTIYECHHPRFGTWSISKKNGLIIFSKQTSTVDAVISTIKNSNKTIKYKYGLYRLSGDKYNIKFYLNFDMLQVLISAYSDFEIKKSYLGLFNWLGATINFEENKIIFGGTVQQKKENRFINWMANQSQQSPINISKYIPANFTLFTFYNINQYSNYYKRLSIDNKNQDFEKYVLPWLADEAATLVIDQIPAESYSNVILILKSKDIEKSKKLLKSQTKLDLMNRKIKSNKVYSLKSSEFLRPISTDLNLSFNELNYVIIDNYFFFSNSKEELNLFLDNIKKGNTILKSKNYSPFLAQLSKTNSIYILSNANKFAPLLKYYFSNSKEKNTDLNFDFLKTCSLFGIQLDGKGNCGFAMTATIEINNTTIKENINLVLNKTFDKELITNLKTVKTESEKIYAVQDIDYKLYLIKTNGNIILEKKLDSQLFSEIQIIDYYSNGEKYFLFNTENSIYVCDQNGETVKEIKLVSKASTGLSFIVYDGELRFYVPCQNSKVYGYDKNGKPLAGWNPNDKIGLVEFPLTYMEVNQKGYLISFNKTGKITISDRTAKKIISKDLDGNFTNNICIEKTNNELQVFNESGALFIINLKGKLQKITFKKSKKKLGSGFVNYSGDESMEYIRTEDSILSIYEIKNKVKKVLKQVQLGENIDKILENNSKNHREIAALSLKNYRLFVLDNQLNTIKKVILPKSKNLFYDLDQSNVRILQIEGKSLQIFSLD
jgi:hypothetical protein